VGPSRPGGGEVELLVGELSVHLRAVEVRGPADAFAAHARHKLARDEQLRPGPPQQVETAAGVVGEQGALSGSRQGCYATFVSGSVGLVVTMTPVAGCGAVPSEVASALRSLTFDPPDAP
jgi:hypothetical protein